ncbi:23S rRNA (guanosine(2251)-2'-O)-methyltransferase RlmB [Georgenia sp. TF02-10]|uniref:23S rRNA (guanosine(2251)-2'-O)-methyltransferase RlmB n=1 Tax=Georgenia sp. TF02-10 TaxID=2917725 RepID=UPI001FA6E432|nr:23S rRNA (guanosine(2251)-2'-O)-methyltransferase RlmB [Georgenia sp. TF02-10]UNX55278.1 23S rRNA (guanosine(2251)-2'-O)-methyltransferase RlmB [Georgenia sp. TF02-10]
MAGNSRRRGAVRKAGSKKGAVVGSGGQGRRALEGKGPTPKATDRPYHPAAKRKAAAERRAAAAPRAGERRTGGERSAARERPVAGRPGPEGPRTAGEARGPRAAGRAAAAVARTRAALGVGADHELIAGRNPVTEAVRAGIPLERVFLAGGMAADDRLAEVVRTATALGAPLVEVSRSDLDRLTDGAAHQGVVIEVPPYAYRDVADLLARAERAGHPPLVVALDGVTDPHNLGAVLRSAGAFGADGVLVPERRAAGVTAAAWKVSAGAAARVPVARATNLVRALGELKAAGCFVVGLDGDGPTAVADLELATEPLVLVTGAEGRGLSRLVRETCDMVAAIPIASSVESLNAAVATGIALYEVSRRRAG